MRPRTGLALWLLAAALLGLACARLRQLGDLGAAVPEMGWALALALVGYCLAAWLVLRRPDSLPTRAGALVMGGAILFRLLLLDTTPSLSDDIYRYLWDARVQAAGHNPYAQAPDAEALADLRDADWARINHPEIITVYPPLAQWFFRGVGIAAPGVTGLKAALVLCDLALIAGLWRLLCLRGGDPRQVVLYAWHPLPVLEVAGNGHVDILGVALLVLALLLLLRGSRHGAAGALAAAVLGKLIPVLAVAAFWRHWSPGHAQLWRRWLDPVARWPLVWVPVAVALGYAPYLDAGPGMWSGLHTFAAKWRFNDSLYGLVYSAISDPKPGWQWDDEALLTARWACLGGLCLVGFLAMSRWRDPVRITAAILGAQLLLSPTVHPWYLLWLLPFVALIPSAPWLAFSWLALLAYQVLHGYRATGVWELATWVRWVEYVPVYALLARAGLPAFRRWRGGPPAPA